MNKEKITMKNLKTIVKAKNTTLLAVGIKIGVSQEAMSQYISGKINPKISTLVDLSKTLNTTTDYLLDLTNNPAPADFQLNEEEYNLINNYKSLSEKEKAKVEAYTQAIIDNKTL